MASLNEFSRFKSIRQKVVRGALVFSLAGALVSLPGCMEAPPSTPVSQEASPSGGMITKLEEVAPEDFKIIDEVPVDDRRESRVIIYYLDGVVDTLTLAQLNQAKDGNTTHVHHYHSGMHGVLMYGMMGYWLGRSMSQPVSPSAYKNPSTYNRVNSTTGNTVRQSATRSTSTRPRNSKSGYGAGKSTRSYGG